jgi:hypothetical protein
MHGYAFRWVACIIFLLILFTQGSMVWATSTDPVPTDHPSESARDENHEEPLPPQSDIPIEITPYDPQPVLIRRWTTYTNFLWQTRFYTKANISTVESPLFGFEVGIAYKKRKVPLIFANLFFLTGAIPEQRDIITGFHIGTAFIWNIGIWAPRLHLEVGYGIHFLKESSQSYLGIQDSLLHSLDLVVSVAVASFRFNRVGLDLIIPRFVVNTSMMFRWGVDGIGLRFWF